MDIWDWVFKAKQELRRNGNERLADLMGKMSNYTCDDHHDKVDAIYPEALALAKQQPNPWLQVFIRHWYLQSQVLHRHNVANMLGEAVELLEFSSRDSTKDCPQSICVVQDLASAYGQKDGPAYVQERLAVCEETLERINPSWPCYECIVTESISALIDDKQYQVALEQIAKNRTIAAERGNEKGTSMFALEEADIYIKLGDYKKAENIIREAEAPYSGDSFARYKSAMTALTLAYQGDLEQAESFELPFDEVLLAHSHFMYWCELQTVYAQKDPARNTEWVNAGMTEIVRQFRNNGVLRDTLQVLDWQIELAFEREDLFSAKWALGQMAELITELSQDLGASERHQSLFDRFKIKEKGLKEELAQSIQQLNEGQLDLEKLSFTKVIYLNELYPERKDVAYQAMLHLEHNGFIQAATDICISMLDSNPNEKAWMQWLGETLLDAKDYETFDQYFNIEKTQVLQGESLELSLSFLIERNESSDPITAIELVKKALSISPQNEYYMEKLSSLFTKNHQYELAAKSWQDLIDLNPDENNHYYWDKMVSATLARQWKQVRHDAIQVGIELEQNELPINEKMESIRVQLQDDDHNTVTLFAQRLGPVHAKITSIRNPNEQQFYGHIVVFDPSPLNQLDHEDSEGNSCDSEGYYSHIYPYVSTLDSVPYFVFDIDGLHPGEQTITALELCIQTFFGEVVIMSGSNYRLTNQSSGEEIDAIYMYAAVPKSADLVLLNNKLKDLFEGSANLVWPRLAKQVNDIPELKRQADIESAYNIE